jgi:hypothetical protein
MANLPHLFFQNPPEGNVSFKYIRRGMNSEEEKEEEPKNDPRPEIFSRSLRIFNRSITRRHKERDPDLDIPAYFDYVEIDFFDTFNSEFENQYRNRFGLNPIKKTEFGKKVLWAISNQDLFEKFLNSIRIFIDSEGNPDDENFDNLVRFVRDFRLLTTRDIIKIKEARPLVHLSLIQNLDIDNELETIKSSLYEYLDKNEIVYTIVENNNTLEISNPDFDSIQTIARNFDVIQSVNVFQGGLIRPGAFQTEIREYGFTVNDPAEDLPIIGILDSGISTTTPLYPLIVNENNEDYDITGTGALTDNIDHGTAVACLAALGKIPYSNDFSGEYNPDARLLSMKIIDTGNTYISEKNIADAIRKANRELNVQIFILTVGYNNNPKYENEAMSDYGILLDQLAHELDILIFISATNNNYCNRFNYPDVFFDDSSNIAPPADSYNNLVIGSVAGNLINGKEFIEACVSHSQNMPAIYTRKHHYNFDLNGIRGNSKLRKPDLLFESGDYSLDNRYGGITNEGNAGLKVLSASPGNYFMLRPGTSFSGPLIANIAAKIKRSYPGLKMSSIKSVLINSAVEPKFKSVFNQFTKNFERRLIGYGIPDENLAVYSNEDRITLVIEDSITPGEIKGYPINLPPYLNDLERPSSVIELSATLCFHFRPNTTSQLEYCPIHIAFGVFKNLPIEGEQGRMGINNSRSSLIKINGKEGWSQDGYFKKSNLSNSQKILFRIAKNHLISENNTFKLAISSRLHPNLPLYLNTIYSESVQYSLVIRIEEIPHKGVLTSQLYNEIQLINTLEAITEIELEAEL